MSSSEAPRIIPDRPNADERNGVVVRPVCLEDAIRIRLEAFPFAEHLLHFEEDHAKSVTHLGAFIDDELVGVVTALQKDIGDIKAEETLAAHLPLPEGNVQWQFRGFATVSKAQKKGVGKELLAACARCVKEQGGLLLWCKAWTPAQPFYLKQGFKFTGDAFHLEGSGENRYLYKYL